ALDSTPLFLSHPSPPPTSPLFPYTTLFRSRAWRRDREDRERSARRRRLAATDSARDPQRHRVRGSCGGRGAQRRQSQQVFDVARSEEHTSELQSLRHLVCRLLLEKKKKNKN